MINGLGPVDGTTNVNHASSAARPAQTGGAGFDLGAGHGIPSTPPPEVLQALDRVQRVENELQARGLNVRFDRHGDREVKAQVVDVNGRIVREIPVVHALELVAGERSLDLET